MNGEFVLQKKPPDEPYDFYFKASGMYPSTKDLVDMRSLFLAGRHHVPDFKLIKPPRPNVIQ